MYEHVTLRIFHFAGVSCVDVHTLYHQPFQCQCSARFFSIGGGKPFFGQKTTLYEKVGSN